MKASISFICCEKHQSDFFFIFSLFFFIFLIFLLLLFLLLLFLLLLVCASKLTKYHWASNSDTTSWVNETFLPMNTMRRKAGRARKTLKKDLEREIGKQQTISRRWWPCNVHYHSWCSSCVPLGCELMTISLAILVAFFHVFLQLMTLNIDPIAIGCHNLIN